MRILFLTSQFPYPADSGGTIKTLGILEYLRGHHNVDIITLNREPLSDTQQHWVREWGKVQVVLCDKGRTPRNLARSYTSGVPLSVERNRSDEMRDAVNAAVSVRSYDCLFADGWLVAQYMPSAFAGLKLLHEHNAEYVIWERHAALERGALRGPLVRREARRVRAYEAAVLRRFDTVFAVSDADRTALTQIGADPSRLCVLPNLPDTSLLDRPPLSFAATRPLILYFGTLSWQPNIEGLHFFLDAVYPRIHFEFPQVRMVIAGRNAPSDLRILAERVDGVDFLGPVDDAEPLFTTARVFIEATRSGGGTKLKVLNALARGLPVVATPEAARGIDVRDGEHILLGSDPDALAASVLRLMRDAGLWASLSENGRALIRKRYRAETAFKPLDDVLADHAQA